MEKIAVIGGGLMGTGIGLSIALTNQKLSIIETNLNRAEEIYNELSDILDKDVKKEKIELQEKESILKKIDIETDLSVVRDKELIIEAIPESLEMKESLLQEIKHYVNKNTIIASNTSGLSISAIGSVTDYPENFIGFHFFFPANKMRLIEVTPSLIT